MKKLINPTIIALIVTFLLGFSAHALFTREVQVSFIVDTAPLVNVQMYEDLAGTIPLGTDYVLPQHITQGESSQFSIYVKNDGDDITLYNSTGTSPGYGAAVTPSSLDLLDGETGEITVIISVPLSTTIGFKSFSVFIRDYEL